MFGPLEGVSLLTQSIFSTLTLATEPIKEGIFLKLALIEPSFGPPKIKLIYCWLESTHAAPSTSLLLSFGGST